ncbi:MAG: GNAT family N-acetyltransferase [Candidatus Dormibacteraeota bacterium]|uniref:GNAT family N-acetyltransferase n=1 Tax=Candidatus Amunia macphersoniae TaxID=3127014 RepID=A0A934NIS8_9BACT|nr:GNAT family N-acetyltransferase [Candidatus Dormibacteraeota bacterium]
MAMPRKPVEIRDVDLEATLDLRTRVLRSHIPTVAASSPEDHLPQTWHLGAFRDGRLVGVISGFPQEQGARPGAPAERFRFMAVELAEQGRGAGRALLAEVTARARHRGTRLLWANARDSALDFYRRLGFEVVGEGFSDSVSGLPHHVVVLEL